MTQIIDRRNSTYNKNKNATNRKRFLDRVRDQVRENVNANIQKGKLGDLAKGDKIKIKIKDTKEPKFGQDPQTGINDVVVPGNQTFTRGDTIDRPRNGQSGSKKKGSLDEDTVDDLVFTLTKDEFLDILFEDLELPDLVKKDIKGSTTTEPQRRGYTTSGNPSNLDIIRSSKNAMGRRIALGRPGKKKIRDLEKQLEDLKSTPLQASCDATNRRAEQTQALEEQLAKLKAKQSAIPYLDPIDVRYRKFDRIPKPITNAVMFCLMDVSGSMGEKEKDISKRFFLLLYLFLQRKYENVELVFVRHTTNAEEVDEQKFFYEPLSGGTQISSGLALIDKIIDKRYDLEKTNIYLSQASDGGNYDHDNEDCRKIITEKLINKLQYFAYIEIEDAIHRDWLAGKGFFSDEKEPDNLWDIYQRISTQHAHFKIKKINDKSEIFAVFKDLFTKKDQA